jgi:hypothetical protein
MRSEVRKTWSSQRECPLGGRVLQDRFKGVSGWRIWSSM